MFEARDMDTRVRRTNRKWRGYLSQGANRENSEPESDHRGSMSRALLQQVRWTIIVTRVPLVTCERGGGPTTADLN